MKVRRDILRYWLQARAWWSHPNRRIRFGVRATALWLISCGMFYALFSKGSFTQLEPNAWGDVAAGVAAPIAFLWLVLTYLQQGEELRLQRRELSLQRRETARLAHEAGVQSEAVTRNERHVKRDVFLRLMELVVGQQRTVAALLAERALGRGAVSTFRDRSGVDIENVSFLLLAHAFTVGTGVGELVSEPACRAQLEQLCDNFELVCNHAKDSDDDGLLQYVFERSTYADLYILASQALDRPVSLQFRDLSDVPVRVRL